MDFAIWRARESEEEEEAYQRRKEEARDLALRFSMVEFLDYYESECLKHARVSIYIIRVLF